MKEETIFTKGNSDLSAATINKKLLNIKEICLYLGIGETKARELVRGHNGFGVRIGNRWYADREKLNRWIDRSAS